MILSLSYLHPHKFTKMGGPERSTEVWSVIPVQGSRSWGSSGWWKGARLDYMTEKSMQQVEKSSCGSEK